MFHKVVKKWSGAASTGCTSKFWASQESDFCVHSYLNAIVLSSVVRYELLESVRIVCYSSAKSCGIDWHMYPHVSSALCRLLLKRLSNNVRGTLCQWNHMLKTRKKCITVWRCEGQTVQASRVFVRWYAWNKKKYRTTHGAQEDRKKTRDVSRSFITHGIDETVQMTLLVHTQPVSWHVASALRGG